MIRNLMARSAIAALLAAGPTTFAAAQTSPDEPSTQIPASSAALTADHPTLVTAFIGKPVFAGESADADNIGEVSDLIVSSDGSITHAVIGVGGFLGIGQKDVAVPFDDLQVVERDGDIRLIYAATRDQLEQAQAFDRSAYLPGERTAQDAAAAPAAAPAAPTAAAATPPAATAPDPAPAPQPVPPTAAAPAAPASTVNGFVSFSPNDQIRASTLLGNRIYGPNNDSIGEVGDLILQDDGKTRAAVIDVGGFLGIGQKQVAIPFDQIQMTTQDNAPRLVVGMTKDQLGQAPAYTPAPASASSDAQPAGTATATTGTTGSQATGTPVAQQQFTAASQDISAEKLIGRKVVSTNDENLGQVGDVVFNRGGDIQAVVVDVGGFLGIGQKSVALTFDQLNVQKDAKGDLLLRVNATQDQLQNAPAYTPAAAP